MMQARLPIRNRILFYIIKKRFLIGLHWNCRHENLILLLMLLRILIGYLKSKTFYVIYISVVAIVIFQQVFNVAWLTQGDFRRIFSFSWSGSEKGVFKIFFQEKQEINTCIWIFPYVWTNQKRKIESGVGFYIICLTKKLKENVIKLPKLSSINNLLSVLPERHRYGDPKVA